MEPTWESTNATANEIFRQLIGAASSTYERLMTRALSEDQAAAESWGSYQADMDWHASFWTKDDGGRRREFQTLLESQSRGEDMTEQLMTAYCTAMDIPREALNYFPTARTDIELDMWSRKLTEASMFRFRDGVLIPAQNKGWLGPNDSSAGSTSST